MRPYSIFPLVLLCTLGFLRPAIADTTALYFREDWKEIPFALPITAEHVNNPDLRMETHGPGKQGIKKSHHAEIENDPFYVWSGQCSMPWALSLRKQGKEVDLSGAGAQVRWRSRQSGGHVLHLLLKLPGERWYISDQSDGSSDNWKEFTFKIRDLSWRHFSIIKCVAEERVPTPDLSRVEQIGFTDQRAGRSSQFSSRVDWLEVYGIEKDAPKKPAPAVKSTRAQAKLPEGIEVHPGLVYVSYGDRQLTLDLYRPQDSREPLPAVVFIHGGGFYKGDPSSYSAMAMELATHGYVTLNMFYRLSGEAPFPAAIQDCKAAVRWARANASTYGIDPEKIASVGGSAGGNLSALLGTSGPATYLEGQGGNPEQSSQIQACVVMAGSVDFRTPMAQESANQDPRRRIKTYLDGSWEEARQNYINASPVFHVSRATPPLCFIDGELDAPGSRYPEMIKKLDARGIYHESHVIENGPHPFWTSHPFFDATVDLVAAFFEKTLNKRESVPD